MRHFQWRECVDVYVGCGLFNSTTNFKVSFACVGRVNSTLQTDLGCPARPGFLGSPTYLLHIQHIRCTAQVVADFSFRKRTELAFVEAQIRIVNVAIHGIGDGLAASVFSQAICCSANDFKISIPCAEQVDDLFFVECFAGRRAIQDLGKASVGLIDYRGAYSVGWRHVRTGIVGKRS